MAESSAAQLLSVALQVDRILLGICRFLPAAFPKLRRLCRATAEPLDDQRLPTVQRTLFEEMELIFADEHELCARGNTQAMWLLLLGGLNVQSRSREGATLLQTATHTKSPALLKLIVERGGRINTKGAYGYTPLHEACFQGHIEVVKCLLEMTANVDALSKNGSTPLLVASREGHKEIVELLLRNQGDANDGGDKGWTPLCVAAGEGFAEVCKVLIEYRGNVHGFYGTGQNEKSALHEAAEQGHTATVGLLLEHKADPNHAFEHEGDHILPFDLAKRNHHIEIASMVVPMNTSTTIMQ